MQLSPIVRSMSESATLRMAQRCREMRAAGRDIVDLSLGEPDQDPPAFAMEAAQQAIAGNRWNKYPPVMGYPDLRASISEKFKRDNGLHYAPEEVMVSTGAKQAIMNVIISLIGPGDEVVIPAPFWVSYAEQVRFAGGTPVLVHSTLEEDYKPPVARIAAAITPRTRLLLYSSPCNPSGSVLTQAELEALAAVVLRWPGLMVVSDEIYEHIVFDGAHRSIGALPGMLERTITVNGISKAFALTGWRIGYIGAPKWVVQGANKVQGQFTSGANGIAQRVAKACVEADPALIAGLRKDFLRRRDLVLNGLAQVPGWRCNKPQGAFYVLPDVGSSLTGNLRTSADLSMHLLEVAGVSLVEGDAFGAPNTLRISYATGDALLTEAIARIAKAVAALPRN
ncbi:MAG: pyridoxal phosphate-dependent aminotransferase [Flavobacteriales bacterium]|nr:pyridoxal phosphate-dependent aminotransferase [Flavobacteriales bacterium]MBP9078664.1 pyridoxal phosphate-dependent aminotransferase [Flavobacteriales bacterium]